MRVDLEEEPAFQLTRKDSFLPKACVLGTVYAYSPYGETTTLGPDSGNPLQFTGRENDATGLIFNRARYWDPILKRWINEDPIGMRGGLNMYAYVGGNPISFTDPEGLEAGTLAQRGYPSGSGATGFNQQQCVQNYLSQYYGSFIADTLVPNFSVLSYIPGSGTSTQAWTSTAGSLVAKGALVGAPYVAGQAMNLAAAASATAAQMTMQSLAAAATPGNALITASKVASRTFGLFGAAVIPFATAANAMALQSCSCK